MAARPWIVIRTPPLPVSFRLDRRVPGVLLVLGLLTLAGMVVNMGQGEYPIAPPDVVRTVLGLETGNPDYAFIVNTLRLPRMLVALLVGAALATSGVILQGLLRNPLAAPEVLGVSAGASLAAVTLIVLFPSVSAAALPPAAFGGALAPALAIYLLARARPGAPLRLILVGVGIAAIAGALTTAIVTFGRILQVSQALVWMAGSVYGRGWAQLWPLLPWLGVFLPAAWLSARDLNALNLGDEVAGGLGVRVELRRGVLLLVAAALAGAAVATAGAVGFIGLMAPHLARRLVGPAHEGLLPAAGLLGGLLVVLADLAGRTLFAPIEIPCGIITAIVGAPYFLYLLARGRGA